MRNDKFEKSVKKSQQAEPEIVLNVNSKWTQ